jgi:hypothetical protein
MQIADTTLRLWPQVLSLILLPVGSPPVPSPFPYITQCFRFIFYLMILITIINTGKIV